MVYQLGKNNQVGDGPDLIFKKEIQNKTIQNLILQYQNQLNEFYSKEKYF